MKQSSIRERGAHVGGHGVLLNEWLFGEVDLQGVICRQAHRQAPRKVLRERVLVVVQEQGVVG